MTELIVIENNKSLINRASILSPLRYPGSKRRLTSYVEEMLKLNALRPVLLIEPFAGGASVALQLLERGLVENIGLGDKDPLVASFWKIVFRDTEWLIDQIENLPITVEKWRYFKANHFGTTRERALACLFLNRTTFSGILGGTAGPIGGYDQTSNYKIDCRFKVDQVVKRIRQAARLSDRVLFVKQAEWKQTIAKAESYNLKERQIFYYFDPPFFDKAHQLYNHYFEYRHHKKLMEFLTNFSKPWLLSYDAAEPIIRMYQSGGFVHKNIEFIYSVSTKAKQVKANEITITNLPLTPTEARAWKSGEEWREER